ncbi:hypothetical protein Tco_1293247 [Tanacetum coccineum]
MAEQQTIKKLLPTVPQWSIRTSLGSFGALLLPMTLFHQLMRLSNATLRKFSSSFSFKNGQRPMTPDLSNFVHPTGLDYNNGKYVAHHTPEVVKKELGKIAINLSYLEKTPVLKNSFPVAWIILFTFVIQVDIEEIIYSDLVTNSTDKFLPGILSNSNFTKDPSKVTDIELTAYMIDVNSQKDSVSPLPLAAKPKKGKSQTVTLTLPKSQGTKIPRALSKKSKRPNSKRPPIETKRNIQLASTGLPSTLDEGTRKSKPLPVSTATHPKDAGENKQPLDRDITFMTSDEGTAKTTPRLEWSIGDKDSRGNIPPANMEPVHPHVADLSGTGAKYQVDQGTKTQGETYHLLIWNQYTLMLLIYQGLVLRELDTQPIVLSTYADVRAFLLSDDECEEDILGAGEEMDEEPQVAGIIETHHQSPPPQADKPQSSHAPSTEASDIDSSSDDILKKYDNTLPLTER